MKNSLEIIVMQQFELFADNKNIVIIENKFAVF